MIIYQQYSFEKKSWGLGLIRLSDLHKHIVIVLFSIIVVIVLVNCVGKPFSQTAPHLQPLPAPADLSPPHLLPVPRVTPGPITDSTPSTETMQLGRAHLSPTERFWRLRAELCLYYRQAGHILHAWSLQPKGEAHHYLWGFWWTLTLTLLSTTLPCISQPRSASTRWHCPY